MACGFQNLIITIQWKMKRSNLRKKIWRMNRKRLLYQTRLIRKTARLHYKGKRYEDLRYEDLKEVDFESVEEVDTFYSFYSLAMGFSFRKEKLDKNIYGIVVRRQLVCSKEGTRKKKGPPKDNPVSHNLGSRTSFMKSVGIPEKGKQRNSHDMQAEEEGGNPNKRKCPHSRRETRGDCLARLLLRDAIKPVSSELLNSLQNTIMLSLQLR